MTHELSAFHWAKNLFASPFNATTLSWMAGVFLPWRKDGLVEVPLGLKRSRTFRFEKSDDTTAFAEWHLRRRCKKLRSDTMDIQWISASVI
jgi:hypothetical protein